MDILKLRINNLFQKYSVELDFTKKNEYIVWSKWNRKNYGIKIFIRLWLIMILSKFFDGIFDSIEVLAYEHGREEGGTFFFILKEKICCQI